FLPDFLHTWLLLYPLIAQHRYGSSRHIPLDARLSLVVLGSLARSDRHGIRCYCAQNARRPKKRVDILPHHLTHRGDFEEPSGHALTDQGIAVRQALCPADKRAKKLPPRCGFVAPDYGVRGGLHFEHT